MAGVVCAGVAVCAAETLRARLTDTREAEVLEATETPILTGRRDQHFGLTANPLLAKVTGAGVAVVARVAVVDEVDAAAGVTAGVVRAGVAVCAVARRVVDADLALTDRDAAGVAVVAGRAVDGLVQDLTRDTGVAGAGVAVVRLQRSSLATTEAALGELTFVVDRARTPVVAREAEEEHARLLHATLARQTLVSPARINGLEAGAIVLALSRA